MQTLESMLKDKVLETLYAQRRTIKDLANKYPPGSREKRVLQSVETAQTVAITIMQE